MHLPLNPPTPHTRRNPPPPATFPPYKIQPSSGCVISIHFSSKMFEHTTLSGSSAQHSIPVHT